MGSVVAAVAAAVVLAAAVVAAGVSLAVVVVVAGGGLGIGQGPVQQLGHTLVGVAGAAGVELDARLGQGHLGTGPDTAADEAVHAVLGQEARQGAVAASVGGADLGGDYLAVLHLIDLELFRVAEVAEYHSVFIGDRDFHD